MHHNLNPSTVLTGHWSRTTFYIHTVRPSKPSTGATAGTDAASDIKADNPVMAVAMPMMLSVAGLAGMQHSLEKGTDRYVQLANSPSSFKSGTFYASPMPGAVGEICDQLEFNKEYFGDESLQDLVYTALQKYTKP
mmetsp:Transcript_18189/g.28223  ORF Transcript_18189/g.28223 Transcript_18189/m.28223 type:complete len:136 (-) Transcript_18189:332-739(-)